MKKKSIRLLTTTALFAALITIMTAYIFHIPVGLNGGYIHFGDSLIYIAACLLPRPYAILAASIGGGLADILTAPMWAPATIMIKAIITLPFTNKTTNMANTRNVIATVIAYLLSGAGYFVAEAILFGTQAAFWVSMSQSLIQSGGSAIVFVIVGLFLDKIKFKQLGGDL